MITSNKFDQNSLYFIDKKAISKENFKYLFEKYKNLCKELKLTCDKFYKNIDNLSMLRYENNYNINIDQNIKNIENRYINGELLKFNIIIKFSVSNINDDISTIFSDLFVEFSEKNGYTSRIDYKSKPNIFIGTRSNDQLRLFGLINNIDNEYEIGIVGNESFYAFK